MRPAGIYKSHDLMTYISQSATSDFGQFSMVKIFVIGSFLTSVDGSKLNFTRCSSTVGPAGSTVIPRIHASGWG